jgi:hypothetical protein
LLKVALNTDIQCDHQLYHKFGVIVIE